ncbi:MAG: hypothetical protein LBT30_06195 [Clostridiales bacterium]|jgi:sporulation integral membrane protein YlbJ|nr:hypothetical protein [Clostridiales bacterium]
MKKATKTISVILLFAVTAALLTNPKTYTASVLYGFELFVFSVLPSLFPFLVLSRAILNVGGFDGVSGIIGKIFKKIYGVPPSGGYVFLLGLLSGYPVGAKLTADMYLSGRLSLSEARTTAAFSSLSGPLFIISLIGGAILKNASAAVLILLCHYLSAIITGLFFKEKKQKGNAEAIDFTLKIPEQNSLPPQKDGGTIGDTVYSAVSSVLLIGGFIAVFNMFCDMLIGSGLLAPVAALLTKLTNNGDASLAILLSFVEMTRGIFALGASGLPLNFSVPLICALVSFGGLSVTLQSLAFLNRAGISAFSYLKIKTVQSITAGLLATVVILILNLLHISL